MMDFLVLVVRGIASRGCVDVNENGQKILSVLTIICCFFKMIPRQIKIDQIPVEVMTDMLLMLRLMPQLKGKKCTDWDCVLASTRNTHDALPQSLQGFIIRLSRVKHLERPEWLYSVPLFHLLNRKVVPFQAIELDPRKIPWDNKDIGLSAIRSMTYDKDYPGYVCYKVMKVMDIKNYQFPIGYWKTFMILCHH